MMYGALFFSSAILSCEKVGTYETSSSRHHVSTTAGGKPVDIPPFRHARRPARKASPTRVSPERQARSRREEPRPQFPRPFKRLACQARVGRRLATPCCDVGWVVSRDGAGATADRSMYRSSNPPRSRRASWIFPHLAHFSDLPLPLLAQKKGTKPPQPIHDNLIFSALQYPSAQAFSSTSPLLLTFLLAFLTHNTVTIADDKP